MAGLAAINLYTKSGLLQCMSDVEHVQAAACLFSTQCLHCFSFFDSLILYMSAGGPGGLMYIFITPQLAGEACQLGCSRITCAFYICKYMYWRYMNWGHTSHQNTMVHATHEYYNTNKLYKVPDAACICNAELLPLIKCFT